MKLATERFGFVGGVSGLLLAVGLFIPAAATGDISLSFNPQYGVINENILPAPPETLTVQVTVDVAATDLRGFSFVLGFDPTYVTPVSVQAGSLVTGALCTSFLTWLNAAAIGDSIAVDGATLGCSMIGPGHIVEMRFVGVPGSFGLSPLVWRDVRLRDSNNAVLGAICIDGTILHKPIIIGTEPETWGRLKGLYR